jgi:hypothetical protein
MKKQILTLFTIQLLFFQLFGQKKDSVDSYINPGLLSASATFEPSFMLNHGEVNYYIMGFIEGKLSRHLSLRGDIHYLLPTDSNSFLKNNLMVCFGMQYGIPVGNFEFHTGFMPGISIARSNILSSNIEVNPTVQFNAGVRYYVWKYFHFFANFSYFHLRLNNLDGRNGLADLFTITAGLGFNFQVLKKYR